MLLESTLDLNVMKRGGKKVNFDPDRIFKAIKGAFCDEWSKNKEEPLDFDQSEMIQYIADRVIEKILKGAEKGHLIGVELVQDTVELILMRYGHYRVARSYILYREAHAKARAMRSGEDIKLNVVKENKEVEPFQINRLKKSLEEACLQLEHLCSADQLLDDIVTQSYDRITPCGIREIAILAARSRMEFEPAYDQVASRLLMKKIDKEVLESAQLKKRETKVQEGFSRYIQKGIEAKRLTPKLMEFDLQKLAKALKPKRDELFLYLGLQTIYDRYLLHINEKRIEVPQYFWMRVAMGLALNEENKEEKAIEFYDLLSQFHFTSATPTLFNSGTLHPQLSSCYLLTVEDDLESIFKLISDNAMLSKWAGGLGNDWTNIRATGTRIKGTNGKSQGLIPFLKIVNDTAVAVNQGGKRKGAVCAYLEVWHLNFEEFLDLRKNTGDDRRRAHDMNTACWIPDLFMKRLDKEEEWTLFSPDDVKDLHDLFGKEFEKRYIEYEKMAKDGGIKLFKKVPVVSLWRKMLSRLFETGHPWITWKDPSNIRSAQSHVGCIHSSNLCTEILLNTSKDETAVCNLGSINLAAHITCGTLNQSMLEKTITTAIRMLDNVIDINFYPTKEAKNANSRHRPIGLGLMGFQDVLQKLGLAYGSQEAVEFADNSMEVISYYALLASAKLARERGIYSSYKGSKWDQGLLPIDTIDVLEKERGVALDVDRKCLLDWETVRKAVKKWGMRNSQVMAIAPTATISQIIGVSQSIEPLYTNLFVKSNLSGDITAVNRLLVQELKQLGLWDQDMLNELKYHDGSIQSIERIPLEIRERFKTSFEVGAKWLIACASKRQKWIDMGQSLNLYVTDPSGKKLDNMYRDAFKKGLKTTYYLRSRAATQVEKSTLDVNKFGIQPKWMKNKSASSQVKVQRSENCSIDGECEACQ